jgi:hypothetical protein
LQFRVIEPVNTFRKLSSLQRSGLLPEKMVSGEKLNRSMNNLYFSSGSSRLSSGLPVVRVPVKMHDRKDVDAIGLNAVQNTLWKAIG